MGFDPSTDKDFLAATPEQQHAYLADQDQDYASANPAEQAQYRQYVTGAKAPTISVNSLNIPKPTPTELQSGQTMTPYGATSYKQATTAGANIRPGEAEAAMGFGVPMKTSLHNAGRAMTSGANAAIPFMTGGASIPVQMAAYGTAGGAQAAMEGESPRHVLGATALNAALPAVTELASPLFASMRNAKEGFQTVQKAAKGIPLKVTPELSQAAEEILRESEAGGGPPPQVVRKFIARMTDPAKGAVEYDEARRFASNTSRMSAKELMGQNPNANMKRLLGDFHGQLNKAVENQAAEAGVLPMHEAAMTEYGQAASRNRAVRNLMKYGKKAAIGAAAGAGAAGAYQALKKKTE
jgi:hypothetical protein